MEKESSNKLIESAKNGDQRAFSELYKEYYPVVRRVIYNSIKDEAQAEDLVLESITKAFKNLDKYTKNLSFEMWIKKVTVNHMIDFIRSDASNKNTISMDDDSLNIQMQSDNSTPEKELIFNETRNFLEKRIDELPKKAKRIMELRYREQLTYQQIADKLKVSIGTVKNTLNRVKSRIKNN